MSKLILKTIAKTLACVIILLATVYGVLMLFFPKVLAENYYKLGKYSTGIYYYELQYDRSKDFGDLAVLCDRLDEMNDAKRTEKYLALFVSENEFAEFCELVDAQSLSAVASVDFYTGKHVISAYKSQGIDKAIKIINKYVADNGYSKFSACGFLISSCLEDMSSEDCSKLASALTEIIETLDGQDKVNAQADLSLLVE